MSETTAEESLFLAAVADRLPEGLFVVDADRSRIVWANARAESMLGHATGELVGVEIRAIQHPEDAELSALHAEEDAVHGPQDAWSTVRRIRRADGTYRTFEVHVRNALDEPSLRGFIVSFRDAEDRHHRWESERRLKARLPDRQRMMEILTHALATSRPSEVAVLFLDLDRFKVVNDSFGHATGDIVLDELGLRLQDAVGEIGVVGRFGGDEYMVVATVLGPAEAVGLAGAMSTVATSPFTVLGLDEANVEVYLSGSIGIALGEDGIDAPTMLHHADTAMYRAKERGRGAWELYDEGMRRTAVARLTMEADLARALDEDAFELWYQPIIDVNSGAVGGFEALARWPRDGGVVMPGTFIPVAEDTGGIHRLGGWALSSAITQLAMWRDQGIEPRFVSVNLSPRQLSRDGLADDLSDRIDRAGVDPSSISLEITETLLLEDFDRALKTLEQLRSVGVTIALDDFGTGWSSLTYLRSAPIDVVKIDRSFIDGVGEDSANHAIVGTVLAMCRALGKRVVAEGVETESQFRTLRQLGCTQAQGYLFAPPMPASEVALWLENHPRPLAGVRGGAGPGRD